MKFLWNISQDVDFISELFLKILIATHYITVFLNYFNSFVVVVFFFNYSGIFCNSFVLLQNCFWTISIAFFCFKITLKHFSMICFVLKLVLKYFTSFVLFWKNSGIFLNLLFSSRTIFKVLNSFFGLLFYYNFSNFVSSHNYF